MMYSKELIAWANFCDKLDKLRKLLTDRQFEVNGSAKIHKKFFNACVGAGLNSLTELQANKDIDITDIFKKGFRLQYGTENFPTFDGDCAIYDQGKEVRSKKMHYVRQRYMRFHEPHMGDDKSPKEILATSIDKTGSILGNYTLCEEITKQWDGRIIVKRSME